MENLYRKKKIANWLIETADGFVGFDGIAETKPMPVWAVELTNGEVHESSFEHGYFLHDNSTILVRDLFPGAKLKTKTGLSSVKKVWNTGKIENLYDPLNVNNEDKAYLSDDLVSHNSFLGSSHTLIETHVLENLKPTATYPNTELHDKLHQWRHLLSVFRKKKPGHIYTMSVDASKIREGSVNDSAVIQIVDITRFPFQQVCVFNGYKDVHYLQVAEIAFIMGTFYNGAYAFVENNEIGQEVVDSLAQDWEYENVFYEKPDLAGYRTTKKTKRLGCSNLKGFIERGKLRVRCPETISQLSTFVKNTKGSFEAEYGYHDDMILALMGCLFFITRPEFDMGSRKDIGEQLFDNDAVTQALEEELPSFGVVDADGVFDPEESIF